MATDPVPPSEAPQPPPAREPLAVVTTSLGCFDAIECVECGHPFDPDESTDPDTCGDCVTFAAWFFDLTPDTRTADTPTPDDWEGDR